MKLSEWIKKNKLSYSQAANQFGIININPCYQCTNAGTPKGQENTTSFSNVDTNTKQTNKQVQPNDFYEEYFGKEKKFKYQTSSVCIGKILSVQF